MNVSELFAKVEEALGEEPGSVGHETSSENIGGWDSLGHITILGMLDDETNGASADIVDLTQANSMVEIIKILSDNNLLDK
jgi:acyl carrier protein